MSIRQFRLIAGTDRLGNGVARILVLIDDEATVRHVLRIVLKRVPFSSLRVAP
jgi:hypothetical protein